MALADRNLKRPAIRVFIATTVMLTFISFWRVAAVVLADLGSSAFYAGGDAEKVIGKSAPWFILAVMLFSYAVRAIYVESSAMFVRGGVYKVVKEAMGSTLAKLSVSALLFDYILTGPISGVSAGQYLAGFVADVSKYAGHEVHFNADYFAAAVAVVISLYFWWKNIQGIHESSGKAMQIMKITTVMVVVMIVWCVVTLLKKGAVVPPLPSARNILHEHETWGWLTGSWAMYVTPIVLLVGFGHSVLAMSGEETLAQVNREIESPKLKNLERAGFVIFVYSLLFTSLVSFFAVMIIPDKVRPQYFANLIGGLAMYVVGPNLPKLIFHAFVVLVGALILSGAVNTAIIGANGVFNRLAEDGVLTEWFLKPHHRYGTTSRLINLIVVLQMATIVASRGNVYLLAALYAFGVIWSFAFKALAVLVLRYKVPEDRDFKVPGNFRIRGTEIPLGLVGIALVLFATAIVNLFTKQAATIAGVSFSLVFFGIFTFSERHALRQRQGREQALEQFRVNANPELTDVHVGVRPGNVLVPVREPHLFHLQDALERIDTTNQDIVVMTVRVTAWDDNFSGDRNYEASEIFDRYEQELFSEVVKVAETEGKPVSLLVVPGTDVFDTIVATAQRLGSSKIVAGLSPRRTPDRQAKLTGDAWEHLREPKPRMGLEIISPKGKRWQYELGPHRPRLREQDLALLHDIWLELTKDPRYAGLHHYDVVALALKELQRDLSGIDKDRLKSELRRELERRAGRRFLPSM